MLARSAGKSVSRDLQTLLNLLDAFGNFAQVRQIASRVLPSGSLAEHPSLEECVVGRRNESASSSRAPGGLVISGVRALERWPAPVRAWLNVASDASAELRLIWLDKVVQQAA